MTKTVCTACNAELDSQTKFCPDCGARSPASEATPAAVAAPTPMAAATAHNMEKSVLNNAQLSVVGYVLTMLALSLPVIGIIFAFAWAFGAKTNPARKNYCRAVLILGGLFLLLAIVGFILNYSILMEATKLLME